MSEQPKPEKPRKQKDWASIFGACKGNKVSDGYAPKSCPECGTSHKLKECPWCGHVRGKKS